MMKQRCVKDSLWTVGILAAVVAVNHLLYVTFGLLVMAPMIFLLGVFLISLRTRGYVWGVLASLLSVLVMNYSFTEPFDAFGLIWPDSVLIAGVMLVVTVMTSALTTQLKRQESDRMEGETERMRANLLRAASHDLRTPLTSIYGAAQVSIENFDNLSREHHIRFLEEIQEDAEWLMRMVENLLSVTRIESEGVHIQKVPTVLEELIDAALMKFKKRCPNQPVNVTIPEIFIAIPMDAILMEQVLLNCLENAVRHARGMTELSLTVYTRQGQAVFEVADDGCGIPSDQLRGLFTGHQKTARADGGRGGMGIGLPVCAAILRAHGGTMEAENRKGGGAVFRFALALEEDGHDQ